MHKSWNSFGAPARPAPEVVPKVLPLIIRQLFIPFSCWSIVMGTGIRDGILWDVLRQVGIVQVAVKGKLQNFGPRHLELVTQRLHIWGDDAQIFDDEREAAQLFLYCVEKERARTLHPLSGLRRRRTCWN